MDMFESLKLLAEAINDLECARSLTMHRYSKIAVEVDDDCFMDWDCPGRAQDENAGLYIQRVITAYQAKGSEEE